MMCLMWTLTVSSAMNSSLAMSRLIASGKVAQHVSLSIGQRLVAQVLCEVRHDFRGDDLLARMHLPDDRDSAGLS